MFLIAITSLLCVTHGYTDFYFPEAVEKSHSINIADEHLLPHQIHRLDRQIDFTFPEDEDNGSNLPPSQESSDTQNFNNNRPHPGLFRPQDNDINVEQSNNNRFTSPSTPVNVPGMGTTRSSCEDRCLTTPQYNPVCGDDDMTYFSLSRLNCARKCGKGNSLFI